VLVNAEAPDFVLGGEYERGRPALHFPDCMALAHAIITVPACNRALL
jgi:hypothetical protein